jgi:hypothetical protein
MSDRFVAAGSVDAARSRLVHRTSTGRTHPAQRVDRRESHLVAEAGGVGVPRTVRRARFGPALAHTLPHGYDRSAVSTVSAVDAGERR